MREGSEYRKQTSRQCQAYDPIYSIHTYCYILYVWTHMHEYQLGNVMLINSSAERTCVGLLDLPGDSA